MASRVGPSGASFEAVLGSLAAGRAEGACAPPWRPLATPPMFAESEACGFAAAAERAFGEFRLEAAAPPPSENPEAIARELGLGRINDRQALQRLRRRFLWDNHPDRRPDLPGALANRRVAVANMLIDRALKERG